ncbi:hypothetical protein SMICM17S_02042 [Streptomyces microflavus]
MSTGTGPGPGSAPGSGDRTQTQHDDDALGEMGYRPELKRTLGNFHTFAAGISYISILTGTFQLFYFGVSFGGPAYWWSWPMVFCGQLMVALCFCELAARYPVAGSVYNWAKKMGGPHVGWLGGWMMMTATMVTLSAVALAYQITLPQIDSWFQFVGDGSGKNDQAANAVLLGTVLILFSTLVNAFGVKLMARINSAGVFIELIAAVALIIFLAAHITRGPSTALTETYGLGSGQSLGYFGAFLTASLASAYVMYGFDTASSLGEESHNPGRNAPRAILRALIASFTIGAFILLFALLAVPDLKAEELSTGGLQYVVLATLGDTIGEVFLWAVVVAITVCVLAVQAAGIRLMFAMARDNNLPAGSKLAKVTPAAGGRRAVVPGADRGHPVVITTVIIRREVRRSSSRGADQQRAPRVLVRRLPARHLARLRCCRDSRTGAGGSAACRRRGARRARAGCSAGWVCPMPW